MIFMTAFFYGQIFDLGSVAKMFSIKRPAQSIKSISHEKEVISRDIRENKFIYFWPIPPKPTKSF